MHTGKAQSTHSSRKKRVCHLCQALVLSITIIYISFMWCCKADFLEKLDIHNSDIDIIEVCSKYSSV